jgi:hypothetical protein
VELRGGADAALVDVAERDDGLDETLFRSEPPWPPQPMEAMLSLAFGDFSWP